MFCRLSSTFFLTKPCAAEFVITHFQQQPQKGSMWSSEGVWHAGPILLAVLLQRAYIMCLRCLARRQQESRVPNSWIMQRNFVASSCCLVCLLPSRCLTRSSRPPLPGLRAEEDGGRERAHQTGVWTLLWRVHRERRPGGGLPESTVGAGEAVDGTAVGTSELGFLRAPRRRRRTI